MNFVNLFPPAASLVHPFKAPHSAAISADSTEETGITYRASSVDLDYEECDEHAEKMFTADDSSDNPDSANKSGVASSAVPNVALQAELDTLPPSGKFDFRLI